MRRPPRGRREFPSASGTVIGDDAFARIGSDSCRLGSTSEAAGRWRRSSRDGSRVHDIDRSIGGVARDAACDSNHDEHFENGDAPGGAERAASLSIGEALGGAQGLAGRLPLRRVTNFASYWFSDKIVLRMYRAQQVGPGTGCTRSSSALPQRAGLPMPRVYVIPDASPNAFATGRNPRACRGGRHRGHPAACSATTSSTA